LIFFDEIRKKERKTGEMLYFFSLLLLLLLLFCYGKEETKGKREKVSE